MTRGKRQYKVVVADSHNLFRRGLSTLIASEADMQVVGEASSLVQALAVLSPALEAHPQNSLESLVLAMEIAFVQTDPEAVKTVRQLAGDVSVLLLSLEESPECLDLTVATGARGYMLKSSSATQLIAGLRQTAVVEERDGQGLSRQTPDLRALAETERSYLRTSPLTTREQEVVTLLAEGRTVREVAAELSLSIKTIEAHKLNLMRKLDIHNRASLVEYAVRSGLVSVQPVARQ